jgi:DNA helicase-2/ATP-dependent DNA helicase PcrA
VGWLPGYGPQEEKQDRVLEDGPGRFKPGDRVRHHVFGDGQVVGMEAQGDDQVVTVHFGGAGKKRLSAKAGKLERV